MTVGAVLFAILLFKYDAEYHKLTKALPISVVVEDANAANSVLFTYLAGLSLFLLSAIFFVFKMFKATKKLDKWILWATGVCGTIFMIVAIACALGSESIKYANDILSMKPSGLLSEATLKPIQNEVGYKLFAQIATLITQLIIFGLMPLSKAVRKVFLKQDAVKI